MNVRDRKTDDRRTDGRTDGRTTTYSEREREFTFAKNGYKQLSRAESNNQFRLVYADEYSISKQYISVVYFMCFLLVQMHDVCAS